MYISRLELGLTQRLLAGDIEGTYQNQDAEIEE